MQLPINYTYHSKALMDVGSFRLIQGYVPPSPPPLAGQTKGINPLTNLSRIPKTLLLTIPLDCYCFLNSLLPKI